MRVRVAVPASVANLGPGFDILALALQLQNDVRAEQRPGDLSIDPGPGAPLALSDPEQQPRDARLRDACAELGVGRDGVHFTCVNRIPIGRGMGSSAAAVLAGVLVGHRAAPGARGTRTTCSTASTELEGHRDNVAAALLGGLAICSPGAPAAQLAVADELRAVLFIPDRPFATTEARQVVPDEFSRSGRDLQREPVRAAGPCARARRPRGASCRDAGSLAPGRPLRADARVEGDRRRARSRRAHRARRLRGRDRRSSR